MALERELDGGGAGRQSLEGSAGASQNLIVGGTDAAFLSTLCRTHLT